MHMSTPVPTNLVRFLVENPLGPQLDAALKALPHYHGAGLVQYLCLGIDPSPLNQCVYESCARATVRQCMAKPFLLWCAAHIPVQTVCAMIMTQLALNRDRDNPACFAHALMMLQCHPMPARSCADYGQTVTSLSWKGCIDSAC